jgi:hypothetical protein
VEQISRVIPHILDDGLSILQYTDDTILFMEHNFDQIRNMKLLTAFEQMSGLKINFHKNEFFYFEKKRKIMNCNMKNFFGCKTGSYPFRYLGIPMHYRKLNNND